MAKDYAKNRGSGASRGNGGRGAVARRGNGGGRSGGGAGLWVGLMLGLAIGLATAGWVWINRPAKPSQLSPGAAVTPAPAVAAQAQKPIPLPPKQPSKYGFYEMLPSYEVVIPREEAAASAKSGKPTVPEIAEPGSYLIQVGAYKTRDEAERSRASLALLAVESKIEQVTVTSGNAETTWFRVRIGPQASLAKAQEILQRLDENGIKGMLVKVKAG